MKHEMKCYCIDDEDWVVARSPEQALSLWEDTMGGTWEEIVGDVIPPDVVAVNGDDNITITDESGLEYVKETRTVDGWIELRGRGLLCSRYW